MVTPGLRSPRERVIQTLAFEGLGLAVVAPLFAVVTGGRGGESLLVVAAVSATVMAWAAIYNTVFDRVEHRLTARVASDRPHGLRTLHAIGLEVSSVLLTTPLIWALTALDWWQALAVDIGLAFAYAAYGYLFHWAYDRWRPVQQPLA